MPLRPDMNLWDYLEVLKRRKWIVILSCFSVFSVTIAYILLTPPLYKSTTTILVIPQQNIVRPNDYRGITDQLTTIEQQVTSRTRLMKVREEVGLFADMGEKQLEEEVYAKMRKLIEIVVVKNENRYVSNSGMKESFSISYTDKDPKRAMLAADRLASLFIEENLKTRERQAAGTSSLLESQLKETKAKLEAQEEKVKQYKMEHLGELPQELQANLTRLDRLQEQYRVIVDEMHGKEQAKILLQTQISLIERGPTTIVKKDGREEVDTSQDTAQALIAELTTRRNQLNELTAKYTHRHPDVIRLRQEVEQLEIKLGATATSLPASQQREKDRSSSRTYLPLTEREREEYFGLRAQIKSKEAELDALKRERETIKGQIAALQAKVDMVPRHEQELIVITRDYEKLKNLYDDLLRKQMDANIAEDLESRQNSEQFQILDPANLPEKPFKPNKIKVFMFAFLLAAGLGLGGAIALEGADQTLCGPKDFQHYFTQKVLACIPDIEEEDLARTRRKTFQLGAILGGILLFLAGVLALLWFQ